MPAPTPTHDPIAPHLRFDLTACAYRVLFWAVSNQSAYKKGCVLGVTQADIAQHLSMSPATVSRVVAELRDADVLRRKPGYRRFWLINPDYLMFGLTPDAEDPYHEEDLAAPGRLMAALGDDGEEFCLVGPDGGAPLFIPLRLDGPIDELYDLACQDAAERMGVPVEQIRALTASGPDLGYPY
ncbi:helix-turn-helix domain-containing protein [Streptomyces sp. NPDC054958]